MPLPSIRRRTATSSRSSSRDEEADGGASHTAGTMSKPNGECRAKSSIRYEAAATC